MSNVGRPPRPTALKMLDGSARKHPSRVNRSESNPAPGVDKPPPFLPADGPAREAWDRNYPMLVRIRVMTEADADAFAVGCLHLAAMLDAPAGSKRRLDEAKAYMAVLMQFGMTPSSRTRIKVVEAAAVDPVEQWAAKA